MLKMSDYIYQTPSLSFLKFVYQNMKEIDQISIGTLCYETLPCKHSLSLHLKNDSPKNWYYFDLISGDDMIILYDIMNLSEREHFIKSMTRCEFKGYQIKLLIDRLELSTEQKINEKNNIIDKLREEIKNLTNEIVELKYKPGGSGYLDAKKHFESML